MRNWLFVALLSSAILVSSQYLSESATVLSTEVRKEIIEAGRLEKAGQHEAAYIKYLGVFERTTDFKALLGIERILTHLHRYEELEEHLQDYLAKNPGELGIKKALARCLFRMGKSNEATVILFLLMEEGPKNPAYFKSIANEFFAFSRYDEAIKVYKKARKSLRNAPLFDSELAYLYSLKMDYPGAIREYFSFLDRERSAKPSVEHSILQMGYDDA